MRAPSNGFLMIFGWVVKGAVTNSYLATLRLCDLFVMVSSRDLLERLSQRPFGIKRSRLLNHQVPRFFQGQIFMYILDLPLDPVINSGKFKGLFLGFPTNVIILLVTSTGKGG